MHFICSLFSFASWAVCQSFFVVLPTRQKLLFLCRNNSCCQKLSKHWIDVAGAALQAAVDSGCHQMFAAKALTVSNFSDAF